MLRLMSIDILP